MSSPLSRKLARKLQDKVGPDIEQWAISRGISWWSGMSRIVDSLKDNRRTVVPGCNSSSKTYTAALIVAWWILRYLNDGGRVVVMAASHRTVKGGIWHEMRELKRRLTLPGSIVTGAWHMDVGGTTKEMVTGFALGEDAARGRARGVGFHAKHLLAVLDETQGLTDTAVKAADTWRAERYLSLGNPETVGTPFHRMCTSGAWHMVQIGLDNMPITTGEVVSQELASSLMTTQDVQDAIADYGEDSDFYAVSVRGEFPDESSSSYFPMAWVRKAQERAVAPDGSVVVFGCDIGEGGDPTEVCRRQGQHARIVTPHEIRHTPDGNAVGRAIAMLARAEAARQGIDRVVVNFDHPGGEDARTACALALQGAQGVLVQGVKTGRPAVNPDRYGNLKAELHDAGRQRFREGTIDIDAHDDVLFRELLSARKRPPVGGREMVERKEDEKKRLGHSPNRRDALLLTLSPERVILRRKVRRWR